MKNYIFLFRGGLDFNTASPETIQEAMEKWRTWIDGLAASGIYNGGDRLIPDTGSMISGSSRHVTDGPFAEGKEMVGGFISVKAANGSEATEIAKGCPIFDYDGTLEVREIVAR